MSGHPVDVEALVEATAQRVAEATAQRLVELLRAEDLVAGGERLVDAQAVADVLGVSREYVYDHKRELGGVPVGSGPRPRWWFDLAEVRRRLDARCVSERSLPSDSPVESASLPHRRRARKGDGADLLPIRGSRAA